MRWKENNLNKYGLKQLEKQGTVIKNNCEKKLK